MPNESGVPTLADLFKQADDTSGQYLKQKQDLAKQEAEFGLKAKEDMRQRDADMNDVARLRKLLGKDASIHAGHIAVDPREAMAGLTPGQKAADVAFGKDYSDYQAQGGKAGMDKNINSMDEAIKGIDNLDDYDQLMGKIPYRGLRELLNPSGVKVEDAVKSAVQGTAKDVLGAQYTEREGTRVENRAYNSALPKEENARRAAALSQQLKAQAAAKQRSARAFEQTGTLKGYSASQPSMQAAQPQPEQAIPASAPAPQQAAPTISFEEFKKRKAAGRL